MALEYARIQKGHFGKRAIKKAPSMDSQELFSRLDLSFLQVQFTVV